LELKNYISNIYALIHQEKIYILFIRIVRNSFGDRCLWFANLHGHSAGEVMDHRDCFGSTDFTKKPVFPSPN